ncbi:unnamed protein product [Caenorhabditis nigoni]
MSFTDNDMCDQVAVIAYDLDSALNTVPSRLQTLLEQNYPLSMLKEEKIKQLVTKYIHCPQVGNLARRVIGKINNMEQKESNKENEKSRKRALSDDSTSSSSSGYSRSSTEQISIKPKNSQPVPRNMTGSSSRLPTAHPDSVQHEKVFVRRVTSSESRNTMLPKKTEIALTSKKSSSNSPPSNDELMGLIASKRTNPAKFVPKSKAVLTNSSSNSKNIPISVPTKPSPEVKKAENDRMERMMMARREESRKRSRKESRRRIAEAQKAKRSGSWEEPEQPKAKRGRLQHKYR